MQTSSPSSTGRRIGSQEPRVRVCPEWVTTYGDAASRLADAYAYPLDPWQRDVLDCWLARDADGRPVAVTCGLDMPRQNGKNYCIEIFEMFVAVALNWHVLHTAHEVKTSMKSFERVCSYFSGPNSTPEMRAMVSRIRRANGQEAVILKNGGIIEFSARSRQAARGFDDIQVVVFDEAQELTPEQVDALLSTLAASSTGTRQIIYTGTPTPPNSPGTVMQRTRERALLGETKACCWHTWSVERPPELTARFEDVLDDVYATNPAMGIRLDEDFAAQEFGTMLVDGFARERLGWWLTLDEQHLLAKSDWMACAVDSYDREGAKVALGVKFATDGSCASLSLAAYHGDDKPYIQLMRVGEGRDGTDWLAERIEALRDVASCVVIDGMYGRDVLVNELTRNKRFPKKGIVCPSSNDVATAASMLKQRVDTHQLQWFRNQRRLESSAMGVERRRIGDRGAWGFGGDDPTPVEACSLALFGLLTNKRDVNRKLRVG